MNLISQHIQEEQKEFDEKFTFTQDVVFYDTEKGVGKRNYFDPEVLPDEVKSFHRSSSLSLVEKIIGEVRSYKRDVPYCSKVMIDMTKEERDNHFFNLSLESIALLLEQGLEEVKKTK